MFINSHWVTQSVNHSTYFTASFLSVSGDFILRHNHLTSLDKHKQPSTPAGIGKESQTNIKERKKERRGEPGETNAVQPHIWSCPEINNHPWHFVLYDRVSQSQGACWEKQFHGLTDHYFQAKAVILSLSGEKTANQKLTEWTRHLDTIKTHNDFHHNCKWTVGSKWPAACNNISSARPASIYLSNYQSERSQSSQINRRH